MALPGPLARGVLWAGACRGEWRANTESSWCFCEHTRLSHHCMKVAVVHAQSAAVATPSGLERRCVCANFRARAAYSLGSRGVVWARPGHSRSSSSQELAPPTISPPSGGAPLSATSERHASTWSESGEPNWAATWDWWYVKICVKGHRFADWNVWEEIWVRNWSQMEEALSFIDSGGLYVHRRLLIEEWQWSKEDGWEERSQL